MGWHWGGWAPLNSHEYLVFVRQDIILDLPGCPPGFESPPRIYFYIFRCRDADINLHSSDCYWVGVDHFHIKTLHIICIYIYIIISLLNDMYTICKWIPTPVTETIWIHLLGKPKPVQKKTWHVSCLPRPQGIDHAHHELCRLQNDAP